MAEWMRDVRDGVELDLLVVPKASRTELAGEQEGRLKVRLAAPPVEGRANKALIQAIAKWTGIKRSEIEIASGETGRRKRLRLGGATVAEVSEALQQVKDGAR